MIAIRNALFTMRSTERVSQLLTGRGTMTVPMMLAQAVRTRTPPITAASARTAIGTTIGSLLHGQRLSRTYRYRGGRGRATIAGGRSGGAGPGDQDDLATGVP